MAYTYNDFVTAATGTGLLGKFTDDDLNIAKNNPEYGMSALKLQQELQNAQTTEQQLLAQETINQLRSSYGDQNRPTGITLFGNANGNNGQTPVQTSAQEAVGLPSGPPAGSVMQSGTNYTGSDFIYDEKSDPSYGALKKTYLREGDRAREDTLAKVSAATGGAPSSYAVMAASQAGDYYNTQFADLVPTLQQNAYQRFLNQYEQKQDAFDRLVALMTQYNYKPTAEELAAAGMSEEMMKAILKRNKGKSAKSSSSGSGGNPSETEEYDAYIEYLLSLINNGGSDSQQIPVGPGGNLNNLGTTTNMLM